MAMNSFWAIGGVGRKRVSSSRSPAMVMTRKSSHHGTARVMSPPASQARLPTSQQTAPSSQHHGEACQLAMDGDATGGNQPDRGQRAEDLPGKQRCAGKQGEAAGAGSQRCAVGPAVADGDGALEADDGAEKGGDHQRPMHAGGQRGRCRHVPAEAGQPGQHAAEQGKHAEEQQRQAAARAQVGHLAAC
jgi:hypothetical protein